MKRFLEKIHNQKVYKVKMEYYKIPDQANVYPYPKTLREEIYRYYQVLIDNKNTEDAVLLHAMYELGLEPYNLCYFTFDALKDNRTIWYYDHKIRGEWELKLTESLYSEFIY